MRRAASDAEALLRDLGRRLRGTPGLAESYAHRGVHFADLAGGDLEALLLGHLPRRSRRLEAARSSSSRGPRGAPCSWPCPGATSGGRSSTRARPPGWQPSPCASLRRRRATRPARTAGRSPSRPSTGGPATTPGPSWLGCARPRMVGWGPDEDGDARARQPAASARASPASWWPTSALPTRARRTRRCGSSRPPSRRARTRSRSRCSAPTDLLARRHPERKELEAAELSAREWRKVLEAAKASGLAVVVEAFDAASRDLAGGGGGRRLPGPPDRPRQPGAPARARLVRAPAARRRGRGRRAAACATPSTAAGRPAAAVVGPPAAPAAAEELRLARARGAARALPRAGRPPRPDGRRLGLRPPRPRPRRRARGRLRREAPHPRPQPQGPRLGRRPLAGGLLPDGGAAAPGRAGAWRRRGRERRSAARPGALDRRRRAHRPRRGPRPPRCCASSGRTSASSRASPRARRTGSSAGGPRAPSRPTRRSGRTCSNEGAHHRRRGVRGEPPRGGAPRAGRRGPRHRQPLDGVDREHRAPQGEPPLPLHDRQRAQRARPRRARGPGGRGLPPRGGGGRAPHRREPGQHHRDERARHRDGAEARQQEAEEGAARPPPPRSTARPTRCPSARTGTS